MRVYTIYSSCSRHEWQVPVSKINYWSSSMDTNVSFEAFRCHAETFVKRNNLRSQFSRVLRNHVLLEWTTRSSFLRSTKPQWMVRFPSRRGVFWRRAFFELKRNGNWCHILRSGDLFSHKENRTLHRLRFSFSLSLKWKSNLPTGLSVENCPKRTCFGILITLIRESWPDHELCVVIWDVAFC